MHNGSSQHKPQVKRLSSDYTYTTETVHNSLSQNSTDVLCRKTKSCPTMFPYCTLNLLTFLMLASLQQQRMHTTPYSYSASLSRSGAARVHSWTATVLNQHYAGLCEVKSGRARTTVHGGASLALWGLGRGEDLLKPEDAGDPIKRIRHFLIHCRVQGGPDLIHGGGSSPDAPGRQFMEGLHWRCGDWDGGRIF